MTYQTLTHSQIQASVMNPRKFFNDTTIEELAASIKTDGLLQNLVVIKPKGKSKKHNIIAGERRFRAVSLLIEKGELPKDFPISVEVKENLTDEEALRIATVENVQRENLTPLEEATALAALVQNGDVLDDIVAQTGLSVATIRRRLSLLGLSEKVKDALAEKKITLSQAEALTVGNHEDQDEVLDDVIEGHYSTADDIKEQLVGELPTLSIAIFPKELYTGDFTTDLLADDQTTYFNDVEQFFDLQKQAAENLVAEYSKTHDWAVLDKGHHFNSWEYGKASGEEKGGVVVFLGNSGSVAIHEGLIKTKASASTTKALKAKAKDTYPMPLRRYMGMHKSLAVQAAILSNPRKAKELAVCNKLARFKAHDCLRYFELEGVVPPALAIINVEAEILLSDLNIPKQDDEPVWKTLGNWFHVKQEDAYDAIQSLTDEQLEAILVFLEVCEFGQDMVDRLDTVEGNLFNKFGKDLAVDMRSYWRPDEGFLKRRNKVQLQALMNESGASAKLASAAEYKKGELVKKLTKFFVAAKKAKKPTDGDLKANDWLPEAMAFPAIDLDRKDEPMEADFDDEMENSNEDEGVSDEELSDEE
jgi:ParB family chromosome partitioning protein